MRLCSYTAGPACLSGGWEAGKPSKALGTGGNVSAMDQVLSCSTSCSCCSCRASARLCAFMRRMIRAALLAVQTSLCQHHIICIILLFVHGCPHQESSTSFGLQ